MSSGASTPPDVPEPSAMAQMSAFVDHETDQKSADQMSPEQVADGVVADAQCAREYQATQPYEQAPDQRPPHEVNRELGKEIFSCVHQPGEDPRAETGEDADCEGEAELLPR